MTTKPKSSMTKSPAPPSTTLFANSHKGRITFDPMSGRWSGDVDGKRTTSQTFEGLLGRMEMARRKASGATMAADPVFVDAAFATILTGELLDGKRLAHASGKNVAVLARLEWDPVRGQARVARYRREPGSSIRGTPVWESAAASSINCVDPALLDDGDRAWWKSVCRARARTHLAHEAIGAIGALWRDRRANVSREWEPRRGVAGSGWELVAASMVENDGRYGSGRDVVVPEGVEFLGREGREPLTSLAGWISREDGTWFKDGVAIALSVDGSVCTFHVRFENEAGMQKVFQSSSWEAALTIANASAQVNRERLPEVKLWRTDHSWWESEKPSTDHWPAPQMVRAAVMLPENAHQRRLQNSMYLLIKHENPVFRGLFDREKKEWSWSNNYRSEGVWVSSGHGDEATMAAARALIDDLGRWMEEHQLTKEKLDEEVRRRSTEMSTRAYNRVIGDPDFRPPPPQNVQDAWNAQMASWDAEAHTHPEVKEWARRCGDAVAAARAALDPRHPARRPHP